MNKGKLISWNDNKGFGFIKSDLLESDTFVHISSLKLMSRKPKIGDFIYFDVEKQPNGKSRATNCRIEGVKALPAVDKSHYHHKSNLISNLFFITLVVVIAVFGYQKLSLKFGGFTSSPIKASPPINSASSSIKPKAFQQTTPVYNFSCDGRQYCSEMKSRAEAEFFIRNCPNTKMDGDHDGIPCENDSRW